jgi:hypothetical protein
MAGDATSTARSTLSGASSAEIPAAPPDAVDAKAPAAGTDPALPTPASSADMALLAAQLQALAEEMARLRLGLDRLLAISESASRQGQLGPESVGHLTNAGLRESDSAGFFAAGAAGGADEARGRVLRVQERLLLEAHALLGGMLAGNQPPGAAGVFTDAPLRKGPVHAKKARAAAAAAAATAAAAAAAAASSSATEEQGDRMELAGAWRPRRDDSRAQEGELAHGAEMASSSGSPAALRVAAVGEHPYVGSDSWFHSLAGSGGNIPAKAWGGVTMAEMPAWDAGASQPDLNLVESNRAGESGEGCNFGAGEGGNLQHPRGTGSSLGVHCRLSACCPAPPGGHPQQLDTCFSGSAPSLLPADPRVFPTQSPVVPVWNQMHALGPAERWPVQGTVTTGQLDNVHCLATDMPCGGDRRPHAGQGCHEPGPATRRDLQARAGSGPGGAPAIVSASQAAQAGPGTPSAQGGWLAAAAVGGFSAQAQGGSGGRGQGSLQDLPPSLPSLETAAGEGRAALDVVSVAAVAATRYCI